MEDKRKNKLISVIIPTYNRNKYIYRAIQSVLSQSYSDFELIIIDDGSTDNTENIVRSIKDRRIRYFKNKKNMGAGASRNKGIQESKGEFIAFLDDDDEWLPEKLEKQMILFQSLSDEYGLVYCGYAVSKRTEETMSIIRPRYKDNVLKKVLNNSILGGSTPVIRKDVFKITGLFNTNLKSAVDWEMWIRIAQYFKFNYVNQCLSRYIVHGRQISTAIDCKINSLLKIYSIHKKLFIKYGKQFNLLKRIMRLYIVNGNYKEAYKYVKHILKHEGRDINTIIQFIMLITMPCMLKYIIFKRSFMHVDEITVY